MLRILPQIALGLFGILPGNYSGITHIRDNPFLRQAQDKLGSGQVVYAVVDDKDKVDGFKLLTLDIDSVSGKVRNASMKEPEGMAKRLDPSDSQNGMGNWLYHIKDHVRLIILDNKE